MSNPDQLVSTLTILAIFLVIIIFVLLAVWILVVTKEKRKNKKTEEVDATEAENQKNKVTYNMNSIFDFMEFEKIEDNMIIQKNGKFLMIIECQGVNYDLMSEIEKTSVEQGFVEFLNTLKSEIQIYVQTRTVNLEHSIQAYKLRFRDIEDKYNVLQNKYMQMKEAEPGTYSDKQIYNTYLEFLKQKNKYEYTKDIIADTEKSSLNSNVLHKKYYIIIPYYEDEVSTQNNTKDEIQSMVFSELYTKAQSIIRAISACSVKGKILNSAQLVELLYMAYNREDAEIYNLNKAMSAQYDSLYSTAPDVFAKKIKVLDEEINKKAIDVANETITKVKSKLQEKAEEKEDNMEELINKMAQVILSENKQYVGEEVADAAIKELQEGGEENEKQVKKATRGRKKQSIN